MATAVHFSFGSIQKACRAAPKTINQFLVFYWPWTAWLDVTFIFRNIFGSVLLLFPPFLSYSHVATTFDEGQSLAGVLNQWKKKWPLRKWEGGGSGGPFKVTNRDVLVVAESFEPPLFGRQQWNLCQMTWTKIPNTSEWKGRFFRDFSYFYL